MLKTNSKKARENMRKHVLDCCIAYHEVDGEDYTGRTPVTDIWDELKDKHSWIAERGGSRSDILRYDLQGLGFGDFYYARKALAEVLEETPEEAARFTNMQAEELYLNLFERHFFELVESEKE